MSAAPDLFTFIDSLPERERQPWLRSDREATRQRDAERLEPIALALAHKVGAAGFTVDNLRRAAIQAGIIVGAEGAERKVENQRALSWLGPFLTSLARRGLIVALRYKDGNTVKRASDRPEAHHNKHTVWTLLERDGMRCRHCRCAVRKPRDRRDVGRDILELDHLTPLVRGGKSTVANVAVSCRGCNRSRGSRGDV